LKSRREARRTRLVDGKDGISPHGRGTEAGSVGAAARTGLRWLAVVSAFVHAASLGIDVLSRREPDS
jgi:hypothetical protein